ncbi:hypothetical protein LCGC14_1927640 [marine sediment metagenome]|uniref:Uncharacterized protein n=1 Tax=marine sediment metagenome TaxID=412755 RepID=A0A0F9ILP6_9ZZZZ
MRNMSFSKTTEQSYVYRWGTNAKQSAMKGRICRVTARGKLNSCAVVFLDDGQQEIISRNALRKTIMKDHAKRLLDEVDADPGPGVDPEFQKSWIQTGRICALFLYITALNSNS